MKGDRSEEDASWAEAELEARLAAARFALEEDGDTFDNDLEHVQVHEFAPSKAVDGKQAIHHQHGVGMLGRVSPLAYASSTSDMVSSGGGAAGGRGPQMKRRSAPSAPAAPAAVVGRAGDARGDGEGGFRALELKPGQRQDSFFLVVNTETLKGVGVK